MKVIPCALNQTPLDWNGNVSRILEAIGQAKKRQADILLLPELAICSVGCEDAFFSMSLPETSLDMLEKIVPETDGLLVLLGLPLRVGGTLFNAVAAIADQKILGFICKQHFSCSRLNYESRWFAPWPEKTHWELNLRGKTYPVGDITLKYGGKKIGVEFCDLPDSECPGPLLEPDRNLDIVLNPSPSVFELGKHQRRCDWVQARARELDAVYVTTNLIGNESGTLLYDGATMIARPKGPPEETISVSRRFSYQPILLHEPFFPSSPPFSLPYFSREEEFTRAVSMGLLDYARKTHTKGFTLSLSGGADSTSVATLLWTAVQMAVDELGTQGFSGRFPDFSIVSDQNITDITTILGQILTCVYQGTKNNSETTRNAAKSVASVLGAKYLELDVAPIVAAYTTLIENALGEALSWEKHDTVLQNIQARTRGPSAWMIANLQQNLLLVASNRSEMAVGYATMDGDTCGGLAPISGIDKHFLRQWLKWMQTEGVTRDDGTRLNLPVLEAVNSQQPTAELRPLSMKQTDESDLMPYEVLEKIEELAIEKQQAPDEILMQLPRLFPMFEKARLCQWVERFFKMWTDSQWKRERCAPGFHLDSRNLSPRSWCRFPILSANVPPDRRQRAVASQLSPGPSDG